MKQILRIFTAKAPLWSLGFRPFFLLVIITAIVPAIVWVLQITGLISLSFSPLTSNQWHANEMIFGFLMSALVGFLLTASANWTGTTGVHGSSLITVFLLFLLTRIIFWTTPFESIWSYRLIGVVVPLWLVFHLTKLFIQTNNRRNLVLIIPLSILVIGQLMLLSSKYTLGYELALYSIRFLLVVIAGRVIPFFTKKALGMEPKWNSPLLEKLTLLTVFLLIFEPFYRQLNPLGEMFWLGLTSLALILNLYRIVNWRLLASFNVKILFILYIAYLWLPIHFALGLASYWGWFNDIGKASVHALTYGCMGIMILGISHRVALGHTGRPINSGSLALIAYTLIVIGSVLRVFGPILAPTNYMFCIKTSGSLWVLAFLTISFEMIPILLSPRLDG